MNDEELNLIQFSWNRLRGQEESAISCFYDLLFLQQPQYKLLFTQSSEGQRLKFITMLNLIVNGLEHIDILEAHLADLGTKHHHLNIGMDDYENVAKTLVQAIDEVSAVSLTNREKNAWMKGLMLVSSIMNKTSYSGT
ncbi:globin domain-containing protein [Alkalimarinus alittae]|uniref:Globin domain-containing protein n=1 Tax=Alkalimarinus alittae TaxID=2961619 RepID=A0ABY6N047_9ALTE|nr:globin domain-containing protein [Alkalimarinus alittae]UZE95463.1 globin domain-containing protein [Alkalimarinus alittae]